MRRNFSRSLSSKNACAVEAGCRDELSLRLSRFAVGDSVTQLQKRAFDGQKQNNRSGVNAHLDSNDRGKGGQREVLSCQPLRDEMDDELLHQVSAVGDARDERGAGNCDATEGQSRAERANQQRGHAESDERELPDAGGDGDHSGFLDPKAGNNERESRQPEPGREIHQALPPLRPEFLDRGQADAEHERIEPGPGGVIDPGLEAAERDAAVAGILPGKKPAQHESTDDDGARNDDGRAAPSNQTKEDQRQRQIELVFDGERPGVGEGSAAPEPDVLHGEKKFPERKHFRVLAPGGQEDVNGENDEVSWQDTQGAPGEKAPEIETLAPDQRREQLPADQVTAEDKEQIDADPAEAVDAAGKREAHDAGVVDKNNDDGESAEEIETGLALAILKARIDSELSTASR